MYTSTFRLHEHHIHVHSAYATPSQAGKCTFVLLSARPWRAASCKLQRVQCLRSFPLCLRSFPLCLRSFPLTSHARDTDRRVPLGGCSGVARLDALAAATVAVAGVRNRRLYRPKARRRGVTLLPTNLCTGFGTVRMSARARHNSLSFTCLRFDPLAVYGLCMCMLHMFHVGARDSCWVASACMQPCWARHGRDVGRKQQT
jgi:hypothetical protein